jgi:hypothetical protein
MVAAAGRAGATPRVTIAVDDVDDAVAVRLGAEMEQLGFAVEVVQAPEAAPSRELLEAAARDRGAIAAFRIVRSRSGVEVWVFDRFTRKTLLREVIVGEEPEPAERASIVATRAVELLRASLLELASSPQVLSDMEVPRAAKRLIAPRRKRRRHTGPVFTLAAGPAIVASPGGIGPSLHAQIEIGLRLSPRLFASALVSLPALVDTIEEDAGRAMVAPILAGAALTLSMRPFSRALQPSLRVGLAAAFLRMEGETARDDARGQAATTSSILPFAGVALRLALGRRVRIAAATDVGTAMPQPSVRFLGERVAHWGMPVVVASAALEIEGP